MLVVCHHHHGVRDVADVLEIERGIVERYVHREPHRARVQRRTQLDDQLQKRFGILGLQLFEVEIDAGGADGG